MSKKFENILRPYGRAADPGAIRRQGLSAKGPQWPQDGPRRVVGVLSQENKNRCRERTKPILKRSQNGPKRIPKLYQDSPKSQDAPKTSRRRLQDTSKVPQTPQEPLKTSQDAPRRPQVGSKIHFKIV